MSVGGHLLSKLRRNNLTVNSIKLITKTEYQPCLHPTLNSIKILSESPDKADNKFNGLNLATHGMGNNTTSQF